MLDDYYELSIPSQTYDEEEDDPADSVVLTL